MKTLKESLFDKDLVEKPVTVDTVYEIELLQANTYFRDWLNEYFDSSKFIRDHKGLRTKLKQLDDIRIYGRHIDHLEDVEKYIVCYINSLSVQKSVEELAKLVGEELLKYVKPSEKRSLSIYAYEVGPRFLINIVIYKGRNYVLGDARQEREFKIQYIERNALKESLFDNDLMEKDIPIEKLVKNFDSDSLQDLSVEERNGLLDQLFEIGRCTPDQLRKISPDLTKNVLIIKRDVLKISNEHEYPCKFVFVYDLFDKTYRAALMDSYGFSRYYWDANRFKEWNAKPTWKGKVSAAERFYGVCSYSVISNEKMAKDIIIGINKG